MIADSWSYHDYTSIAASPLSNRVGVRALSAEMRPRILARSRAQLGGNLPVLLEWLAAREGSGFVPPQAAGMDGHLRFGIGGERDVLIEGLGRFSELLQEIDDD